MSETVVVVREGGTTVVISGPGAGPTGPPGPPGDTGSGGADPAAMNYRGVYSPGFSYAVGDVVNSSNRLYYCWEAINAGADPLDVSKWDELAVGVGMLQALSEAITGEADRAIEAEAAAIDAVSDEAERATLSENLLGERIDNEAGGAADPDTMKFRGQYSDLGPDFTVGDTVTDTGRLLYCTSDYTASEGVTILGASAYTWPFNTAVDVPLPNGSGVGDLVLFAYASQVSLTAQVNFATFVVKFETGNFHSDAVHVAKYYLDADDLSLGKLVLPGLPAGVATGITATFLRGVGTIDTAHAGTSPGDSTEPSVTLTADETLLYRVDYAYNPQGTPTATQANSTNVVFGYSIGNYGCASGLELVNGAGPSSARTWTLTNVTMGGSSNNNACGVLPLIAGGPDMSHWAVLTA
jgi:hypothetical protein